MANVKPFTIAVSDEKLKRLRQKLELTNLPDEHENVEPWTQGSPLSDVKRLTRYWKDKFDWRATESRLNEYPQYTTPIKVDGFGTYDIHFVHQKSKVENGIPLLFAHGWPGSFIEVTKVLPLLVQGGKDFPAFHVVAPSLVDFGFSSASRKSGFNVDQQAEAFHKVMLALGYDEYVVQGGDLGYLVSRFLAIKYGPEHVKAHHVTNAAPEEPTEKSHPELHAKCQATPLTEGELIGLGRTAQFSKEGNGYFRQQATKPQTTAYFMTDSPVGLLAWIYEKLHDWVDDYKWADDEILTWISIYYFSEAGPAASSYIYHAMEHRDPPAFAASAEYSPVPIGISRFPKDLILLPKLWNHTLGPVIYENEHHSGGHFAAWERPGAVVKDLREMFGKDGGGYNVVPGKSGYQEINA